MSKEKEFSQDLIDFIGESPSHFHAAKETERRLGAAGFEKLDLEDSWKLKKGGKYFTSKNNSAVIAFTIGKKDLAESGFRLVGAHTDSPTFRIKPNPEMLVEGSYLKLNTEVYGGPIFSTWFDRPLSIAGRVNIASDNPLEPKEKLVDLKKAILTIPNLAIHMNREVNTGFEYNAQKHTLPLVSMVNEKFEKDNFLVKLLAEELDVDYEDILDFEVFLYATEKGQIIGLEEEFISVGRLDDLAMVHASMEALIEAKGRNATNVAIAFDNEEVGSRTKQGAASPLLKNILKRINTALGNKQEDFYRALEKSFIISADQAHAVHPNFMDKTDPTSMPMINKGPVIKIAANQAYTTDSRSSAIYEAICKQAGVPVQKFVNRSDLKGGSTIGPISSTQLNISSVDIGNALLAMHSVRELGGVKDQYYVYRSFVEYYNL